MSLNEFQLHRNQWEVFLDPARFRVLVAGRRFGKTHLAFMEILRAALKRPNQLVWYVGPTEEQAVEIACEPLKKRFSAIIRHGVHIRRLF